MKGCRHGAEAFVVRPAVSVKIPAATASPPVGGRRAPRAAPAKTEPGALTPGRRRLGPIRLNPATLGVYDRIELRIISLPSRCKVVYDGH
jgi:hypothetical protein